MTQADYLKAQLDLLKIIISAFFAFIFLLVLYIVQNPRLPQIFPALSGVLIFGSIVVMLGKMYDKYMNELKNVDEKGYIIIEKKEAAVPGDGDAVMKNEPTQDIGQERVRDMSFGEKLKFHSNEFIEIVNLDKEKKSKLIEILLLVGSILVALKTVQGFMLVVFMLFILTSIFHYIFIQNQTDKSEHSIAEYFVAFFIAATFSLLVNVNLLIANSAVIFIPSLAIILFWSYNFLLILVIWVALMPLSTHRV